MKNFLLFIVLLLGIVFYFGIHYALNNNDEGRILRIGVECDYPPNNWEENRMTDTNIPLSNKKGFYAEGYDVQIAKIVAKSIGANLEVKKIAWDDLIPALNRREIDAIFSGMLDTNERKKLISFSDVYGVQFIYSVMVKDSSKYSNAENLTDFEGARFVGQKGTNLDAAIEQLTGAIHLPPVDTVNKMFDELSADNADGIIVDSETITLYQKTYPHLKEIKFPEGKGFVFDYSGVCAGIHKQNLKLADEINNVLKNISLQDRQKIMDHSILRSEN